MQCNADWSMSFSISVEFQFSMAVIITLYKDNFHCGENNFCKGTTTYKEKLVKYVRWIHSKSPQKIGDSSISEGDWVLLPSP